MNCRLCGADGAWMSASRGQPICDSCFRRENMSKRCPSCGGYMIRVNGWRAVRVMSRFECPGCFRSPVISPGGWRKEIENPLWAAAEKGKDAAGTLLSWSIVSVFWTTVLALIALGIVLFTAIDYYLISRWIEDRAPFFGEIYFWGPKIVFAGPYAIFWGLALLFAAVAVLYRLISRRRRFPPGPVRYRLFRRDDSTAS